MKNKNKLKQLQVKANKLYRDIIDVIDDMNDATKRFYEKSSKYAKLLKKIEEQLYGNNSKTSNIKRSKKKKKKGGVKRVRRAKATCGRGQTRRGRK